MSVTGESPDISLCKRKETEMKERGRKVVKKKDGE